MRQIVNQEGSLQTSLPFLEILVSITDAFAQSSRLAKWPTRSSSECGSEARQDNRYEPTRSPGPARLACRQRTHSLQLASVTDTRQHELCVLLLRYTLEHLLGRTSCPSCCACGETSSLTKSNDDGRSELNNVDSQDAINGRHRYEARRLSNAHTLRRGRFQAHSPPARYNTVAVRRQSPCPNPDPAAGGAAGPSLELAAESCIGFPQISPLSARRCRRIICADAPAPFWGGSLSCLLCVVVK